MNEIIQFATVFEKLGIIGVLVVVVIILYRNYSKTILAIQEGQKQITDTQAEIANTLKRESEQIHRMLNLVLKMSETNKEIALKIKDEVLGEIRKELPRTRRRKYEAE